MRVVAREGRVYWSDLGHGVVESVAAPGATPSTTPVLITNATIATLVMDRPPANTYPGPVATPLLVRGTTAYFIETNELLTASDAGAASGGAGTSIVSAQSGITPKTLFSASDGQAINAMALSPDGTTLYFSHGSNLFAMPSGGITALGDLKWLGTTGDGYALPPTATAMATDGRYLAFMKVGAYEVGLIDTATACADASSTACTLGLFGGRYELLDTIQAFGVGTFYYAEGSDLPPLARLYRSPVGGVETLLAPELTTLVTGFAIGAQQIYVAAPLGSDPGYIYRVAVSSAADGGASVPIAQGQPTPTSLALDGTNVYWTTSRCDIRYIADSPQ